MTVEPTNPPIFDPIDPICEGETAPILPTSTNTYTVVGTDANGCQNWDQVEIIINENISPDFEGDDLYACAPHVVNFTNLTGINNATCLWDFGDGTMSTDCNNVTHTYANSGNYTVTLTLTTPDGCSGTHVKDKYIHVVSQPNAQFSADKQTVNDSDTEINFTNESTPTDTYIWDFGDGSPESNDYNTSHGFPEEQGESYVVTLIATNGPDCADTAKMIIEVLEELIFYVPNTFTPDGDHYNEIFQPIFTSGFDPYSYTLLIFNRWGELIFESHDVDGGWDGTYGGKIVQDGTYVWKMEFGLNNKTDDKQNHVGHVSIIR